MLAGTQHAPNPHRRGVGLAVLAALAFGLATPFVQHFGAGLGGFTTAACLYGGAALVGLSLRGRRRGAGRPLVRSDRARLAAMAVIGATIAPALLVHGLQNTGATSASLVLNLEAVFTLFLAALVYREPLGAQALGAAAAMLAGGLLLVLQSRGDGSTGLGLFAVAGATAAWAIDNTLSRPLSEAEPLAVVSEKAGLGAILGAVLAVALGEPAPSWTAVLPLIVVGALGYGGSLALYLAAQRHLGAGRTGSVYALGPFVGALMAIALGDRDLGWATLGAAALFGLGVWLHLSESHGHHHVHEPLEHEHFHRHDDGHHDHAHETPAPARGHSHPHRHERLAHDHPHAPDLHHSHEHSA